MRRGPRREARRGPRRRRPRRRFLGAARLRRLRRGTSSFATVPPPPPPPPRRRPSPGGARAVPRGSRRRRSGVSASSSSLGVLPSLLELAAVTAALGSPRGSARVGSLAEGRAQGLGLDSRGEDGRGHRLRHHLLALVVAHDGHGAAESPAARGEGGRGGTRVSVTPCPSGERGFGGRRGEARRRSGRGGDPHDFGGARVSSDDSAVIAVASVPRASRPRRPRGGLRQELPRERAHRSRRGAGSARVASGRREPRGRSRPREMRRADPRGECAAVSRASCREGTRACVCARAPPASRRRRETNGFEAVVPPLRKRPNTRVCKSWSGRCHISGHQGEHTFESRRRRASTAAQPSADARPSDAPILL